MFRLLRLRMLFDVTVLVGCCVVVVVGDDVSRSHSTLIGIIVGVVLMLFLLLLVVAIVSLAVRRRRLRRKSHTTQSSSVTTARCTSSRSTTSVSTISAGNGSVLPLSFSGVSLVPHQQVRGGGTVTSDNVGCMRHDDPPPPYSSTSGSPADHTSPPHSAMTAGLSRDRRTGRSLPPTPSRPPAPRPIACSFRDSLCEHIYDEPSSLFHDGTVPPPDTRPSTNLLAPVYPRSSMSRIRLGTNALRPATLSRHSPQPMSRQRPCGFGTYQPRRSRYMGPQMSDIDAAPQPIFVSNVSTSPADMDSEAAVHPSARMLMYPTALSPEPLGGVYDQPWDSTAVLDTVSNAAAIPLTALPPRSAATLNSASARNHALSRPHAWNERDLSHREPGLSNWSQMAGSTDDTVQAVWPHAQKSAFMTHGSAQRWNQLPPASESFDSSSSPLVTRPYQDSSDLFDLLSPTCV